MTNTSVDVATLLTCILHFLPDETKTHLSRLIERRVLDGALHELMEAESLPEWFAESFAFRPRFGLLDGLREAVATATTCATMNYGGPYLTLRIAMSDGLCGRFLCQLNLAPEEVRRWGGLLDMALKNRKHWHRVYYAEDLWEQVGVPRPREDAHRA